MKETVLSFPGCTSLARPETVILMNFLSMRTRAAHHYYQIRKIYAFQGRNRSLRTVFKHLLCQMPRNVNVVIIDGAAVVNMVKPKNERTFSEYAAGSFIPYIRAQLSTSLDWILCGMNT